MLAVGVHSFVRIGQLLFDGQLYGLLSVHVLYADVPDGNHIGAIVGLLCGRYNADQGKWALVGILFRPIPFISIVFFCPLSCSQIAVFIGPILAVLFSVFGFCTAYVDITPMFQWMWHISYFRAGFHGVIATVYGMNRSELYCPPNTRMNYCHFRNPKIFLREVSIRDLDTDNNVYLMSGIILTMHLMTVLTLWFKLNKR